MLRDQAQALMLISVDKLDWGNPLDWYGKALEMIPGSWGETGGTKPPDPISEFERQAINVDVKTGKYADINNPYLRIPIPLTDMLLPIHQTSYSHHHNLGVSKQEVVTKAGDAVIKGVFRPGTNQKSLQFEIKNNLSKISVVADIIAGISTSMASRTVKVSYFSSTDYIKDATLIGVNRTSVQGTDKEIFTMSLELESMSDLEKQKAQAKEELEPADPYKNDSKTSTAGIILPPEIREGYLYYPIMKFSDVEALRVTDKDSDNTVQFKSYRVMRVVSTDATGAARNMLGIEYDGQFITLPDTRDSAYKGFLALLRWGDTIYLGVKR